MREGETEGGREGKTEVEKGETEEAERERGVCERVRLKET